MLKKEEKNAKDANVIFKDKDYLISLYIVMIQLRFYPRFFCYNGQTAPLQIRRLTYTHTDYDCY